MKLKNLINDIKKYNEDDIIFIENIDDINSNIIISDESLMENLIKEFDGIKYHYLIEVNFVQEFVHDVIINNLSLNDEDIALQIYNYAINDA